MSVRRRAIKTRVELKARNAASHEAFKCSLEALRVELLNQLFARDVATGEGMPEAREAA